jgi:hypothetical protein
MIKPLQITRVYKMTLLPINCMRSNTRIEENMVRTQMMTKITHNSSLRSKRRRKSSHLKRRKTRRPRKRKLKNLSMSWNYKTHLVNQFPKRVEIAKLRIKTNTIQ